MRKAIMSLPIEQRYELIRNLYNALEKDMNKCISILGICRNSVYNAITINSPETRKYEKKLKEEHLTYIYCRSIEDPHITAEQLSKDINQFFNITVSARTINRARNESGLTFRPPIRSVKISEQAKIKRYNFTHYHLENKTNFRNVVFADESWFLLGRNKRWVWIDKYKKKKKVMQNKVAHPPKIMVWGGIGYNFKTNLVIVEGSLNSDRYLDQIIFGSDLIPDADSRYGIGEWILQQDNAPPHVSRETMDVLNKLYITLLENWPPYSPDLNIIEVVWAIMEIRVEKEQPQTIDQLISVVKSVWDSLSYETINRLVNGMERRLLVVNQDPGKTIFRLPKSVDDLNN